MVDLPIKNLTNKFQSLKTKGEEITSELDTAFSKLEKRNIQIPEKGSFEKKVKASKAAITKQLGK